MTLSLSCLLLTACGESLTSSNDTKPIASMPNPASAACVKSGGTLSIKPDSTGAEVGWCTWPSGTVCEEWSYFRGECKAKLDEDLPK